MKLFSIIKYILLLSCTEYCTMVLSEGILYPRQSETREQLSLDGLWDFYVNLPSDPLTEIGKNTPSLASIHKNSQLMPVPSSYNDIVEDASIRDHVGAVWYERTFFVPSSWSKDKNVWLRFSSVSYSAQVWINGQLAMKHEIGHLPFQNNVTPLLNFGESNVIIVACNNTLHPDTIPQGGLQEINTDDGKKIIQTYTFDFFNYAGIDRPVTLYTTPKDYIDDINVHTDINGTSGIVKGNLSLVSETKDITCVVKLFNKNNSEVASGNCDSSKSSINEPNFELNVPEAQLWWPYLMNPNPGYLYTLQVQLKSPEGDVLDVYRLPIGIRTIKWTNTSLLINDKPVYLHGFGRHEDSDIRGKGLDLALITKDYNLIKWVGANAYRTSHYPYAEEIMDLADRMGIMIVDECPSVNTDTFTDALLKNHKQSLTELIRRDKNRPSVIIWSIANEPRVQNNEADAYFGSVASHVRSLDSGRPISIATIRELSEDKSAKHLDIISLNRYNAWYSNVGHLDMITKNFVDDAKAWHQTYNKPILISEYGADTQEGLHLQPSSIWSEEFQIEMMSKHFKAFDILREEGWFIGEFIWNFADFKTDQDIRRVGGNKKGIFTRNRQPKAAAHHMRKRYWALSQELYNSTLPEDLFNYFAPSITSKNVHNEL